MRHITKDGKRHGKRTFWYGHNQIILGDKKFPDHAGESGKKRHEKNYKDGNLVAATYYSYHLNGQIRRVANYKDGQLNGKTTVWFKDGQIEFEKNYKDGQLNGKSSFWLENGEKFMDASYKDEQADGKWTFWKKNRKDEERNYKDGNLVDKTIFKYRYFTGDLKSRKKYKDGKCIQGC